MTNPQLEALALLVGAGEDGAVSARTTAHGFVGTRAASSLVAMGYARTSDGISYYVTPAGRAAYEEAMGR